GPDALPASALQRAGEPPPVAPVLRHFRCRLLRSIGGLHSTAYEGRNFSRSRPSAGGPRIFGNACLPLLGPVSFWRETLSGLIRPTCKQDSRRPLASGDVKAYRSKWNS